MPSFSLDQGFWYSLTESLQPLVKLGSVVRVPLSGRRVRGFVVEVGERPPQGLRPVAALSMAPPIFDLGLLKVMQWAAQRYVAPLAVVLERALPPNLVNSIPTSPDPPGEAPTIHPLAGLAVDSASGRRRPPVALIERFDHLEWMAAVAPPILASGKSVMVVTATAPEADRLAQAAEAVVGEPAVSLIGPHRSDAENSRAWAEAQTGGRIVVGTPRVAGWSVNRLGLAVVVEEGRRAMKERQTPTVHVRDFLRMRGRTTRHNLAFVGPTPTLETLAGGASVVRASPRAWPPVEIVDRTQEPPTPGVIGHRALNAVRAVAGRGGRIFVFAHRRGYAPAMRCERCRTIRRCPKCGARPEPAPDCARCGQALGPCRDCGHERFVPLGAGVGRVTDEIKGLLGPSALAEAGGPVTVGSEADIAGLNNLDLAVAVDADGLILGSHFRAAEEALRVLARLAGVVGSGGGRRALVQTSLPEHGVLRALQRGDPMLFLEEELEERRRLRFPPASELVVVEMRGSIPPGAEAGLAEAAGPAAVMGPAHRPDERHRWLIQADDLTRFRHELRPLVQKWREAGTTVRIDTDPIDL
ncbi:MAG TPA: hypothetical protein VJR05_00765 [Acidimicrobiia bacterium]|nr:hypothetical protein [Acidimicrobiia bacterium]